MPPGKIKFYLPLLLLITSTCFAQDQKWELVWSDEFSTEGLPDESKWSYDTGFIANKELQYYTAKHQKNARVRNGTLVIEVHKEVHPNEAYDPTEKSHYQRMRKQAEYTSARLVTRDKAEFQYGRIEVRAKIPTGKGTWPAIWMLGHTHPGEDDWPDVGEIDIMENVGVNPNDIHGTVHTKKYNHRINTHRGGKVSINKPFENYHVYAIEWDAEKIKFFVDDNNYYTFENEKTGEDAWPFDKMFYIILNIAYGGIWGGEKGVDDSILPVRMYVDYVRVYKKKA